MIEGIKLGDDRVFASEPALSIDSDENLRITYSVRVLDFSKDWINQEITYPGEVLLKQSGNGNRLREEPLTLANQCFDITESIANLILGGYLRGIVSDKNQYILTHESDMTLNDVAHHVAQRIQWLSEGMLARHLYPDLAHEAHEDEAEKRLYREFVTARRTAEAASVFAHVKGADGGRYPLTGVGDVNTYALFAETILQIHADSGRAGFIVPTGIATDDSTKAYFGSGNAGATKASRKAPACAMACAMASSRRC